MEAGSLVIEGHQILFLSCFSLFLVRTMHALISIGSYNFWRLGMKISISAIALCFLFCWVVSSNSIEPFAFKNFLVHPNFYLLDELAHHESPTVIFPK